jgi:WD40 repeat protein
MEGENKAIRTSLAWSSDDELLAAARNDGAIEIWNTSEQRLSSMLKGHTLAVTGCSFSPEGYLLRTTSWDASSRIWDAAMGKELVSTERRLIDFTSDGRLTYLNGIELKAGICRLAHQDHIQVLHDPALGNSQTQANENGIRWATFSPDESLLAIHGATFVDFWEVATQRKRHRLPVDSCARVLFHPDGSFMLTALPDGLFRWPIHDSTHESGRTISIGPPEKVLLGIPDSAVLSDVRWLPDNRRVAIFDNSKPQVLIRDLTLPVAEANAVVRLPALYRNIQNLAVSPDGKWLAAGSHHQPTIQIWNLLTLQRHEIIPEPSNPTPGYTVNFSPDSRWLIVAVTKDVTESGHLVYETGKWNRHSFRSTAFSPGLPIMFQNRLIAMTGPNTVEISDVESGRTLSRIFSAESRFNIPVATIRDNSVVAMVSGSGTDDICLWDFGLINRTLTELGLAMDHDLLAGSVAHPAQRPISLTIDDGGMVERNRIRALITNALREAETLAMAGKSDQAIERIQSLQDFETDNHLLLNSIAWSLAANSLCQPSHAACAVSLMERALKLQPDESSYWNTMGVAHYRNNDFKRAIEALQKSESLAPGQYFFDNAVFVAMSYWRMGEQTVARQWLSDAIKAFEKQSSPTDELRRFRQDAESLVTPEQ